MCKEHLSWNRTCITWDNGVAYKAQDADSALRQSSLLNTIQSTLTTAALTPQSCVANVHISAKIELMREMCKDRVFLNSAWNRPCVTWDIIDTARCVHATPNLTSFVHATPNLTDHSYMPHQIWQINNVDVTHGTFSQISSRQAV